MIELAGVTFRYEEMVMRFDLSVEAGSFVAVIGPSGAGKSTLINLIAGFDHAEAGTIRLDGRDMTKARPADRPVTTLFQDHNLFAHLTAAQNVGLGLHPGLRLTDGDRKRVDQALAEVGLDGLGARMPAALSGGERQRVALARSIVRDRPILLLDEPFAALDPALRREMTALVDRLRRERGLTVVMVSHQLDEVRHIGPRAVFVHDGRIVADGPLRAMIEAPPTPEVARYVA